MNIYGAGLAGLLTARLLQGRTASPITVHEAQPSLPNNHHALLRFRSDIVAKHTGIPFREVSVTKGIVDPDGRALAPSIALNNQYSLKVTGRIVGRSILNLAPGTRYIAPPDFIAQLAEGLNIEYNSPLRAQDIAMRHPDSTPIISTIPLPALMKLRGMEEGDGFAFRGITSIKVQLQSYYLDVYQTLYCPDPGAIWYRASITGNLLTIECMDRVAMDAHWDIVDEVIHAFGIPNTSFDQKAREPWTTVGYQAFGKLLPAPEQERRALILHFTDALNIYSIGRFATWRQILLDDVVKDIHWVSDHMRFRDTYARRLTHARSPE